MNKTLKHMFYSLALSAVLCATPTMASNNEEPVVLTEAVTTGGSGGMVPDDGAKPTEYESKLLQNIVGLLFNVKVLVDQQKVSGQNPDVENIIDVVFTEGGLGQQSVELIGDLTSVFNDLVQDSTNPNMQGCKALCARLNKGVNASADRLVLVLPLVKKYYHFFDDAVKRQLGAPDIILDLIQNNFLADIRVVLTGVQPKQVQAHKKLAVAKVKASKEHDANIKKRAQALARAAAKAEKNAVPVVAPVVEDKGKEEAKK